MIIAKDFLKLFQRTLMVSLPKIHNLFSSKLQVTPLFLDCKIAVMVETDLFQENMER